MMEMRMTSGPSTENGPDGSANVNAPAFVFAHLSDPHLSSLDAVCAGELVNKRVLGYLSWRHRRRHQHRGEVLTALVRDLLAMEPDHVVVTGDLTHIGLHSEFRQVSDWLETIGTPTRVTVIPGNHDAYVQSPWERSFALWSEYMASDIVSDQTPFPLLRIRGEVALIGLSSACPSAPFFATGSVGREQLARLGEMLRETGANGLFRVVMVHHPPLPGSERWRKRLTDGPLLCEVLARQGAELVLHGHSHRGCRRALATAFGPLPVIGVPSASIAHGPPGRRARYHLYRVARAPDGWDVLVSARDYLAAEGSFITHGEYRLNMPAYRMRKAGAA